MADFSNIETRAFNERSYLEFDFNVGETATSELVNRNNRKKSSFKVRIPFFENPQITENKQARLGKYKLIGRNSNLYSFLGADSTQINLVFNITLPNLFSFLDSHDIGSFVRIYEKDYRDDFNVKKTKPKDAYRGILQVVKDFESQYYNFLGLSPTNQNEDAIKVKALYYFWMNIIRCSVIGTSDHRSPPPTVRLNFGMMYKNTPFLVERYQISNDEKTGYDVMTMLPRRFQVSLTMEELRVGNFNDYSPYGGEVGASVFDGENVAGWEYVLDNGSLDPMISPITDIEV